jgi:hypothetical protein
VNAWPAFCAFFERCAGGAIFTAPFLLMCAAAACTGEVYVMNLSVATTSKQKFAHGFLRVCRPTAAACAIWMPHSRVEVKAEGRDLGQAGGVGGDGMWLEWKYGAGVRMEVGCGDEGEKKGVDVWGLVWHRVGMGIAWVGALAGYWLERCGCGWIWTVRGLGCGDDVGSEWMRGRVQTC